MLTALVGARVCDCGGLITMGDEVGMEIPAMCGALIPVGDNNGFTGVEMPADGSDCEVLEFPAVFDGIPGRVNISSSGGLLTQVP